MGGSKIDKVLFGKIKYLFSVFALLKAGAVQILVQLLISKDAGFGSRYGR